MQFQPLAPAATEPIYTTHSAMSHHATMVRRDSTFLSLTEEPASGIQAALRQRRPSNFLILAPVTSDSYPKKAPLASDKKEELSASTAAVVGATAYDIPIVMKTRRSTSVSSTSSEGRRLRFLKLNPVHWGGEEGEDDYAIDE